MRIIREGGSKKTIKGTKAVVSNNNSSFIFIKDRYYDRIAYCTTYNDAKQLDKG